MKNKILILSIVVLSISPSCYRDLGNYDYTAINELEISGIPSDTSVQKFEILKINPIFKRSIDETEDGLIYSWKCVDKEISTNRNLEYEIPSGVKAGRNDFYFTVTDTKTGMRFLKTFDVNVVSPFSWGYYFLCENDEKRTVLSYFSTKKDNERFINTTSVGDYEFGFEPVAMGSSFGNISSLGNYYWTFSIVSKKGDYNVITTENGSFMPNAIISSESFITPGITFNPTETITLGDKSLYYVSDGKVVRYSSGLLYRPGNTPNYKWSNLAGYYGYIFGFDEITRKYYVLKTQINDPVNGLVADNYALDRVVPIDNQPDITGLTIIGTAHDYDFPFQTLEYIVAGNNEIKIITLKYADNDPYSEPALFEYGECSNVVTIQISGVDKNSKIIELDNDWYITAKNKIYSSPKLLPSFKEFITLPQDLGDIVAIQPSAKQQYLLVATYNPASSEQHKGSFAEVEIKDKKYTIYQNVFDKCVKIGAFNSDPASWPFGFGDPK